MYLNCPWHYFVITLWKHYSGSSGQFYKNEIKKEEKVLERTMILLIKRHTQKNHKLYFGITLIKVICQLYLNSKNERNELLRAHMKKTSKIHLMVYHTWMDWILTYSGWGIWTFHKCNYFKLNLQFKLNAIWKMLLELCNYYPLLRHHYQYLNVTWFS